MAQRTEQREESRARILASAGRGFRRHGYGGLGVDGLAKDAGVTSGAFYAHFKSKAAAFRAAVLAGMQELQAAVTQMRETQGPDWRSAFIDFYLGERRRADLSQSCALQSLTGEVARAGAEARQEFERELEQVLDAATKEGGTGSVGTSRVQAIALLALLSGGVSLARAVNDPALAEEIAEATRTAALTLGGRS